MMYEKFSPKQVQSMSWWMDSKNRYDAIVCDGSVRSGKTMSMTIGFVMWSCHNFDGETFAFCGKTIDSLKRNVINPMTKWLEGVATIKVNWSRNFAEISMMGHSNRYYFFGGKDESSASLIQGITLAGVLLDETALMPRSFVEQALARCSVSGAKFWFNCNPDSPYHWFYREWILKHEEKKVLHLHFTMQDNFSLSQATMERYERMYSGVFYDRFVKGLWVVAEGLVYPMFDRKKHVRKPETMDGDYYISIDYGTMNPTSMGLWLLQSDGTAYRIRESYYDGRKSGFPRTDEGHYQALVKLAGNLEIQSVIIDPSAASFIACIHSHGTFRVQKADNSVIAGIADTSSLLEAGKLYFAPECEDILREFSLYRWDEKKADDSVIKENDHAMDDMRYFVRTIMWRSLQEVRRF